MTNATLPADKTLLLVDDDKPFLTRLARAMETRGFEVLMAESVAEGVAHVKRSAPSFAGVDLRLADGNGLDVIEALQFGLNRENIYVVTTVPEPSALAVALAVPFVAAAAASVTLAGFLGTFWPAAGKP